MRVIENHLLESWGDKEGTMEFLEPREAREAESLLLWGRRIDFNLLLGKRDDLNRLLDMAGALQLGLDGSPGSPYLCLE